MMNQLRKSSTSSSRPISEKSPQTPQIYGFVGVDGNIYLDETVIHPEHPIHEYTHLWDRVVAKKDPKLWKRGIELMKTDSHSPIGANCQTAASSLLPQLSLL